MDEHEYYGARDVFRPPDFTFHVPEQCPEVITAFMTWLQHGGLVAWPMYVVRVQDNGDVTVKFSGAPQKILSYDK